MDAKIDVNSKGFWLLLDGHKSGGSPRRFEAAIKARYDAAGNADRKAIAAAIKAAASAGGLMAAAALVATECEYRESAAPPVGKWGGYVNVGAQVFVVGHRPSSWDERQISHLWAKHYVGRVLLGKTAKSEGYRAKVDAIRYAVDRAAVRDVVLKSPVSALAVFCDAFAEATGAQAKSGDFGFFATASAIASAA